MRQARLSVGSASGAKHADSFSTSWEELGLPDDEYFRRLTPQPEDRRSSDMVARKASSVAILPDHDSDTDDEELPSSPTVQQHDEGETLVHDGAGRQPTFVHGKNRVKSSEGLLKEYSATGVETTSSSPVIEGIDKGTPSDDMDTSEAQFGVQRAKSVDLGNHARRVSAGSAVLLDIPSKRQSTDPKRRSAGSTGDIIAEAASSSRHS